MKSKGRTPNRRVLRRVSSEAVPQDLKRPIDVRREVERVPKLDQTDKDLPDEEWVKTIADLTDTHRLNKALKTNDLSTTSTKHGGANKQGKIRQLCEHVMKEDDDE